MNKFTTYNNGAVRNESGKLIAFIDYGLGTVTISGVADDLPFTDLEHACDLIAELYTELAA